MNKHILLLDSLDINFSLTNSNEKIIFSCQFENGINIQEKIDADDLIIGYYGNPKNKASVIFRVEEVAENLKIIKTLEIEKGARISEELAIRLEHEILCDINEETFQKILKDMLSGFGTSKTRSASSLKGFNKIYYGVPGCGKSWKVEHEELPQDESEKDNIFRTTFYLDYSNTDFVGQIYPTINGDTVEYTQIPGPFTKALERAYRYPNKNVYLVIEEINRGNAAAIFGDLFQLLDRLKENYDGRVAGDSEYPISNEFIEGYFKKRNEEITKHNEEMIADGKEDLVEPLIEFASHNIFIPNNLTIYATMNTSDQNVFPLDTAFKRRWQRERVLSDWTKTSIKDCTIPGTEIDWEKFAKGINKAITSKAINSSIGEDKCLGSHFANETMLLIGNEDKETKKKKLLAFVNNVLDYLFNDVTKFEHSILFVKDIESFEKMHNDISNYNFEGNLDLGKWLNADVMNFIKNAEKV